MPKGDRNILKADPEDGTTPIANLLLEGIVVANLTSRERAAILFLIRRTYGWQINGKRLKEDVIPLSVWGKVLQVRDSTRASKILSELEKKGIIKRESLGVGKSYIYRINTSLATWNNCLNQQLLSEMTTLVLPKKTKVALSRNATPSNTQLATRKEKFKSIIKTNIPINKEIKREVVYKQDGSIDEDNTIIQYQSLRKIRQILRGEIPCLEANKRIYRQELKRLRIEEE